jgi:trans-aconitate 2-methyltransferase
MTKDWDARTYDRVADPMARWGLAVLDRLPLAGDETVLDAGCGSGRVTERLAERLPHGRVIALDASPAMLDEARRRLARFGSRVTYVEADLALPLPPIGPVDAILSTAVFHWVRNQDGLFRHLAAVIRPGGRLVAQSGGAGNIERLERVVAGVLARFPGTARPPDRAFETPEATEARLRAAGFIDVRCWLTEEPTRLEPGEPLEAFLETVCLREYLAGLPDEERAAFVGAVADAMPEPVLDYVRLNIDAVRA